MSVQSKLGAAAIAAASTIAAFGASAHDTAGFYANLYAGPSFLSSTNLTETRNAGGNVSGNASFDTGFGFGGATG